MIVGFLNKDDVNFTNFPWFMNQLLMSPTGFQNILGISNLKVSKGQAFFTPSKIHSKPNTEVFFKVTSPTILRYYSEYFSSNDLSHLNIDGTYAFIFSIKFRDCIVGEVFLSQINRFKLIFTFKAHSILILKS